MQKRPVNWLQLVAGLGCLVFIAWSIATGDVSPVLPLLGLLGVVAVVHALSPRPR